MRVGEMPPVREMEILQGDLAVSRRNLRVIPAALPTERREPILRKAALTRADRPESRVEPSRIPVLLPAETLPRGVPPILIQQTAVQGMEETVVPREAETPHLQEIRAGTQARVAIVPTEIPRRPEVTATARQMAAEATLPAEMLPRVTLPEEVIRDPGLRAEEIRDRHQAVKVALQASKTAYSLILFELLV